MHMYLRSAHPPFREIYFLITHLTYEYRFFVFYSLFFIFTTVIGLQDVVEMAMIRQRLIELEGRMVVLREAKVAGTKQLEAELSGMKLE